MTVQTHISDWTALIIIDSPPLNLINQAVRSALMDALDRAETPDIRKVILTGAGDCFIAGADVREFEKPPLAPYLPDILNRIENFPVPVVAAINGNALGGGLELALTCRWRIVAPSAMLGLPEVKLGIVPGAGGTQRLPRLVGLTTALELIPQGKLVEAQTAKDMGLVEMLTDNPVSAAWALDCETLVAALPVRDRPTPLPDDKAVRAARETVARRMAGQSAPLIAIALIQAASNTPFDAGLKLEREAFLCLRSSPQTSALRHIFFAESRAQAQRQGRLARVNPVEVTSAVVGGGGNMGASIGYALAEAGILVTIVEVDGNAVDRARANIERLYDQAIKRGRRGPMDASGAVFGRISFVAGCMKLPPADIAIEAAIEDMGVKQEIFVALDKALPKTALLATNTSYLDVNHIARNVDLHDRVLGVHFFSPVYAMDVVEVVRGTHTSDRTLATALRLVRRLGKFPVLTGRCDGFIGNRILTRYRQATDIMMIEGALPWQIDAAMRAFGFAMGPYEVQDLSGLDIAHANRRRLGWRDRTDIRYVPIADRLVEDFGRLGRKAGAGWYDYYPGCEIAEIVEDVILEESRRAGLTRRSFSAREIQERALAAMIDEAVRILDEGIAERPSDIDLVMVHGYAFPRWRGGLMYYAEDVGLAEILHRIETYAAEDPISWKPGPLMQKLVREDRTLADFN